MREHAYETNDKKIFWLCDMLHNIPGHLNSEEGSKKEFINLIENTKALGLESWINSRMVEFYERFPEYKLSII